MALLPIIYLSILITSVLIILVVAFSYIASKIRNRNNEDRILALAYGNNPSNSVPQRENRVVIQRVKSSDRKQSKSDRELYARERRTRTETERTARYSRDSSSSRYYEKTNNHSAYTSERITNSPNRQRIEIVNNSFPESKNYTGGEVNKKINNSADPLYFYSGKNDPNDYYRITSPGI